MCLLLLAHFFFLLLHLRFQYLKDFNLCSTLKRAFHHSKMLLLRFLFITSFLLKKYVSQVIAVFSYFSSLSRCLKLVRHFFDWINQVHVCHDGWESFSKKNYIWVRVNGSNEKGQTSILQTILKSEEQQTSSCHASTYKIRSE